MTDTIVVISNLPDIASAEVLAKRLVEERLAACVNILPEVTSLYTWEGKLEQARETPLLIKSTRDRYEALQAAIIESHPYVVPEIIALPVVAGLPAYLDWVESETRVSENE